MIMDTEKKQEIIKIFLENSTKGAVNRQKVFNQITDILYETLLKKSEKNYNFDIVFEDWLNQISFFAEGETCLKILLYILINPDQFKSYAPKAAVGMLSDDKWLEFFETLTNQEALILHKCINTY